MTTPTPLPPAVRQRLEELAYLLTTACLHPQLQAMGIPGWEQYALTYDTTPLPLLLPIPADRKEG